MDGNVERGVPDRQEIDDHSSPAGREQPSPPDRILSAVGNEYRRAILDSLTRVSDGILEYDALVEHVAERVTGDTSEGIAEEQRQRVRIALRHTHLPKLEEVRMIDYEPDTGHVQFVGGELEQEVLTLVESYYAHE